MILFITNIWGGLCMEYTNFLQELTLFYMYNQLDITSFKDELDYLISLQNPDWITSHSDTWSLLRKISLQIKSQG